MAGQKRDRGTPEHPAAYHMLDVAAVAKALLADHPRRDLFCLLIARHDLGKIGKPFREMLLTGSAQSWRHWEVTEAWLRDEGAEQLLLQHLGGTFQVRPLIVAIAGHHGRPPNAPDRDWTTMRALAGAEARGDAMAFPRACLELWPAATLSGMRQREALRLTWFLAGVTTVADWVGSNTAWFAPTPATHSLHDYLEGARRKAPGALAAAGLVPPAPRADPLFDFALRPMQQAARDIALAPGPMLADHRGRDRGRLHPAAADALCGQGEGRLSGFADNGHGGCDVPPRAGHGGGAVSDTALADAGAWARRAVRRVPRCPQ